MDPQSQYDLVTLERERGKEILRPVHAVGVAICGFRSPIGLTPWAIP